MSIEQLHNAIQILKMCSSEERDNMLLNFMTSLLADMLKNNTQV